MLGDVWDGRVLTGAWIETSFPPPLDAGEGRRVLTGAWIETVIILDECYTVFVASSRARGLKLRWAR
ncbi:hypothetical protein A989_00520 [Xanthomonas translucens DAR61454]|nr:hypothetical protein A989_00520 [Xanthomonas translucens DAR61454]